MISKRKYLVLLFLHVLLLSAEITNAQITPEVANKVAEKILDKVYELRHQPLLNSLDTQDTIDAVNAMKENQINLQRANVNKVGKNKQRIKEEQNKLEKLEGLTTNAYLQQVRDKITDQSHYDTIAVAFNENDNILLAGNVRTRNIDVRDPKTFEAFAFGGNKLRTPFTYENFGLKNSDLAGITSGIRESENILGNQFSAVTLVKPVQNIHTEREIDEDYQTAVRGIEEKVISKRNDINNRLEKGKLTNDEFHLENEKIEAERSRNLDSAYSLAETNREALYHAEVALDKYLHQQGQVEERKFVLGTSKALCDKCKFHVNIDKRFHYDDREGLAAHKVKHWAEPGRITVETLNLGSSPTTTFTNVRNRSPGRTTTTRRPRADHLTSSSKHGDGAVTIQQGASSSDTIGSTTSSRALPPSSSSSANPRVPPPSSSSSTSSHIPPQSSSSSTNPRVPPSGSSSSANPRVSPPSSSSTTSSRILPQSSSSSTNPRVPPPSSSPSISSGVPRTGSSSSSPSVKSPSRGLPSPPSTSSSINPSTATATSSSLSSSSLGNSGSTTHTTSGVHSSNNQKPSSSSTSSGIPSRPVARPTTRSRIPTRRPPPRPTAKPNTKPVSTPVRPTSPSVSHNPTSAPHSPTRQPTKLTTRRSTVRPTSRATTRPTTHRSTPTHPPPSRSSN